ncbi:hypothetical protein KSP39_PZI021103 [Platanthera zijinensis]|uniref:Uncharacterized protein n=1 Tax=Platanthera zijinensis TaxID=2320716 RepID=A0AAP0AXQ8_9ASPA
MKQTDYSNEGFVSAKKIRMACQNPPPSIHRRLEVPPPARLPPPLHIFSSFLASPSSARRLISPNLSLASKLHCSYHRQPSAAPTISPRATPKTAEYVFPDPIPEFAEAETIKFRDHLLERLSKKDIFDDSVEEVVRICTEQILSNFLHTEYGGPGTLMVVPFIDMADTINERGLPGGPQAARAAVIWAQNNVDRDWKDWTGDPNL